MEEKVTGCSNQEWLDSVYDKLLVKMRADRNHDSVYYLNSPTGLFFVQNKTDNHKQRFLILSFALCKSAYDYIISVCNRGNVSGHTVT